MASILSPSKDKMIGVANVNQYVSSQNSLFVFPTKLRSEVAAFPYIRLACGDKAIHFPIPSGLTFADSATYSAVDLGLLGFDTDKTSDTVMSEKLKAGGAVVANLIAKAKMKGSQYANVPEAITLATKKLQNPGTATSFQGTSIREFEFTFKMMPQNEQDTLAIKDINTIFRLNLYPEADLAGLVLSFPPVWSIKFFNGSEENKYIPKIYEECYLVSFTSTYNADTNMFHKDGSPVGVDISLKFQETKALTREDQYTLSKY
jgi:hypothetical protein